MTVPPQVYKVLGPNQESWHGGQGRWEKRRWPRTAYGSSGTLGGAHAVSEPARGGDLALALSERWCNGCRRPAREWGPVCPGMYQGDWTHYHSSEWWRARLGAQS